MIFHYFNFLRMLLSLHFHFHIFPFTFVMFLLWVHTQCQVYTDHFIHHLLGARIIQLLTVAHLCVYFALSTLPIDRTICA